MDPRSAIQKGEKKIVSIGVTLGVVTLLVGASIAFASLTFTGTNITGGSNVVIDASNTISIGTSTATGITIGSSGMTTTFPGNVSVAGSLFDGSGNKYVTSTGPAITLQGGTNAFNITFAANTTYVLAGDDSESAARSVSANGVTIDCGGHKITRSGATDLFDVSGSHFTIKNCVLDGNNQSGSGTGPLINLTGDYGMVAGNTVQNSGTTNPSSATFLATAGNGTKFEKNTMVAMADQCISVTPSTNVTISGDAISDNFITFAAPSSSIACIFTNNQASGAAVVDISIHDNFIESVGADTGQGLLIHADNSICSTPTLVCNPGPAIFSNTLYTSARLNGILKAFGINKGRISSNYVDDLTKPDGTDPLINLGDAYDTAVTGNTVRSSGSFSPGLGLIDYGRDTVTGNVVSGVFNNTTGGIRLTTTAGVGEDTTVSGNTVDLGSSSGAGIYVSGGTASFATNDITITGNHVGGTGVSGQIGVSLVDSAGTTTNIGVSDNDFYNLPTGVSIGSGVANTFVGEQMFSTVTTPISNSGTGTRITYLGGMTYAQTSGLGTLANGSNIYVSNATIGACSTGGTGAFLRFMNGTSTCY